MDERHPEPAPRGPSPEPEVLPQGFPAAHEQGGERVATALASVPQPTESVPFRQIAPILLAQLTMCVAAITPTAYSLAVWLERIAPEQKDALLPVAVGVPSLLIIFLGPIVNVLSDRTRSRFGRRRTWVLVGMTAGTLGSLLIALVPSIPTVIIGWTVASNGYSIMSAMILVHFSDRLPEHQRGRVMGLAGAITQLGPLVGVIAAGALAELPAMLFLLPAGLALLGNGVFAAVMKDPQYTGVRPPLDLRGLAQGYWFNPRRYPNLGWVWLNKAFIYLALSVMTLYSVYLLSSRLGLEQIQVAGIVSLSGMFGVGGAILAAIGAGVLSDRLQKRKPFLVVAAVVLAGGLVLVGTAGSVVQFVIGTVINAMAAGIYGAVDQALQLDVLPAGEDQNGRYLAVLSLAQQIPQGIGPFLAGAVLALAGGEYGWVYFVAAGCALVSILAVAPIRIGRSAAEPAAAAPVPVAAP